MAAVAARSATTTARRVILWVRSWREAASVVIMTTYGFRVFAGSLLQPSLARVSCNFLQTDARFVASALA